MAEAVVTLEVTEVIPATEVILATQAIQATPVIPATMETPVIPAIPAKEGMKKAATGEIPTSLQASILTGM